MYDLTNRPFHMQTVYREKSETLQSYSYLMSTNLSTDYCYLFYLWIYIVTLTVNSCLTFVILGGTEMV